MYYLSEANNLEVMDKALIRRGGKRSVFANKILSTKEINVSNKASTHFRSTQTKEQIKAEIWKNFTVPVHNKKVARSAQVSTPASERQEAERR